MIISQLSGKRVGLLVVLLLGTLTACVAPPDNNQRTPKSDSKVTTNGVVTGNDVTVSGNPTSTSSTADEQSYTIIPGDVLQVTVWKEEGLDRETLVLPDGSINFPLVGSVDAKGKTPYELQADLKDKLKKYIPDAAVTVVIKAALGHTVSVIGQVTKPGEIMMGHRLTVMQALSQAGGLTPYASEGNIIILHHENGKETSIPFPYDDVIEGKKLDKDIALSPGDVVVVPTASAL